MPYESLDKARMIFYKS